MRIDEVDTAPTIDLTKLVALSQFLLGRAEDTGATKKISTKAFIQMARNLGIGITQENLVNLVSSGPLRNIIANVTPQEVIFKGAEDISGMTQGQANSQQNQNIVAGMAKRAMP